VENGLGQTFVGVVVEDKINPFQHLKLAVSYFKCYACEYLHYERVEDFICPACGEECMGSMHFTPQHDDVLEAIEAIECGEYIHGAEQEIKILRMEKRALEAILAAKKALKPKRKK